MKKTLLLILSIFFCSLNPGRVLVLLKEGKDLDENLLFLLNETFVDDEIVTSYGRYCNHDYKAIILTDNLSRTLSEAFRQHITQATDLYRAEKEARYFCFCCPYEVYDLNKLETIEPLFS